MFVTLYIIISFAAFLLTTGGYSSLYFLFYIGPFYLAIWILLTLVCITSKRVRYSPILIYFILFIQAISILFNIPDSGFFGITCETKNFVQSFFDRSACSELWMSHETYIQILVLYAMFAIVFVFDVLRLRFLYPQDR